MGTYTVEEIFGLDPATDDTINTFPPESSDKDVHQPYEIDATLNNVRVFGGAQLLVTGGDLTVTEGILIDVRSTAIAGGLGSSLLVGAGNSLTAARLEGKRGGVIEVEGDAATTINEAFTLDRGGIYRKKVGAVD